MTVVKKRFGKYVIEMRKFSNIKGFDEHLPFHAELWVNKTHIANCHNNGYGLTEVIPICLSLFNDVAKIVCATKGALCKNELFYTMPILADELSWQCYIKLTLENCQKNGLIFMAPDGHLITVPFNSGQRKNVPIAEMLLTQKGQEIIRQAIEKYEKNGYTLMNNNIRYSQILF